MTNGAAVGPAGRPAALEGDRISSGSSLMHNTGLIYFCLPPFLRFVFPFLQLILIRLSQLQLWKGSRFVFYLCPLFFFCSLLREQTGRFHLHCHHVFLYMEQRTQLQLRVPSSLQLIGKKSIYIYAVQVQCRKALRSSVTSGYSSAESTIFAILFQDIVVFPASEGHLVINTF